MLNPLPPDSDGLGIHPFQPFDIDSLTLLTLHFATEFLILLKF